MKKTNDTPMEDFQALYNRQVNRCLLYTSDAADE